MIRPLTEGSMRNVQKGKFSQQPNTRPTSPPPAPTPASTNKVDA